MTYTPFYPTETVKVPNEKSAQRSKNPFRDDPSRKESQNGTQTKDS